MTFLEYANKSSNTFKKISMFSLKEAKTRKEAEEMVKEFSGLECSFHGITKKDVYNGCVESLFKVLKKYPLLADSGSIKFFSTTSGIKEIVKNMNKGIFSEEKINDHVNYTMNELFKTHKNLIENGVPVFNAISAFGLFRTVKTLYSFYEKNNIRDEDVIDDRIRGIILEELKKKIRKMVLKHRTSTFCPRFSRISGSYAFYAQDGNWKGIYFVPSNMQKSVLVYELINKTSNQKRPDSTHKSITIHELGHAIDDMLSINKNDEVNRIFNENRGNIRNEVSSYAATNIYEFIAECFCEYIDSEEPREIPLRVGQIIDNEYFKYALGMMLK